MAVTFISMLHYEVNRGGSGLHLPHNIIIWAMIALLVMTLYWPQSEEPHVVTSPGKLWLLIGALMITLPGLWPASLQHVGAWLPRVLGLWGGIILLLGLFRLKLSSTTRQGWLLLILLSAWVQATLALLQWFVFTADNWMEFDPAQRPYGIFQQVNVLASYLATGYAIAAYLFMVSSYRVIRIISTLTLLVFPGMLLLLQSRIGWVGGVTTLLLLSLYYWRQRKMAWLWLCSLISLLVAAYLLEQMIGGSLVSKEGSNKERWLILEYTWLMIRQQPWQGWGYGSFESAFAQKLIQNIGVPTPFSFPSHPHNEVLYGWAEGGIVALVGMLVLAIGYIKPLLIQPKVVFPLWVLTLPIALHLMTELPLYQSAAHWLVLILLGRLMVPEHILISRPLPPSHWRRWLHGIVVLLACCTLLFMITGFKTGRVLTLSERSGLVNMQPLDNLVNPYIQWERYQYIRHINLLLQFNHNPDPALLSQFRVWAEQYIQLHNDPNVYQSLIMITQYQNDLIQANHLRQIAHTLFPENLAFR
ncbi:lipid A core-O-antigen ligase [Yersinia enterocolitica]|uniref:Lipid A core-O-antigen ligase n=2 Tax=Yersinia enterocolitica TaxID=630 RepID=A0A9P1PY88_YEREN|nr:lipid A core-O-antigen ligase [Yersinia enterocolitica]CNK41115.1 lipid A core-O-antigen ligase [Yersinia enterocolitica]CQH03409.1 lipid A core-O-antigen ligase [Yersinia enterocolitica]CQH12920.1 lipid A core-O-antigen ligase [Yersinia enterocolitica]CQH27880.1 lipid A core-O-antigen ligase [Yersinia enterocolitica]